MKNLNDTKEPDAHDNDDDGYEAPIYLCYEDRQKLQKQINSMSRKFLDTIVISQSFLKSSDTKSNCLTPELTAPPRRGPNSEPKLLGGCGRTPGWARDSKRVALGFCSCFSLLALEHPAQYAEYRYCALRSYL